MHLLANCLLWAMAVICSVKAKTYTLEFKVGALDLPGYESSDHNSYCYIQVNQGILGYQDFATTEVLSSNNHPFWLKTFLVDWTERFKDLKFEIWSQATGLDDFVGGVEVDVQDLVAANKYTKRSQYDITNRRLTSHGGRYVGNLVIQHRINDIREYRSASPCNYTSLTVNTILVLLSLNYLLMLRLLC